MLDRYLWLVYVGLAGLAWGTYVPLIAFGGKELGGKPEARLMAILCVGVAYFLIGVLFPLVMFFTGQYPWPTVKGTGLTFSGLAGVAGAVGALCVIFATSSARASGVPNARLYIAPLIFGLAPVINTLVSAVWHPEEGWTTFYLKIPDWKLWLGIVLVGAGAALVLFSKEEAEEAGKHAMHHPPVVAVSPLPPQGIQESPR
jgi:drug/metabolite transporter (DMT)-like permease